MSSSTTSAPRRVSTPHASAPQLPADRESFARSNPSITQQRNPTQECTDQNSILRGTGSADYQRTVASPEVTRFLSRPPSANLVQFWAVRGNFPLYPKRVRPLKGPVPSWSRPPIWNSPSRASRPAPGRGRNLRLTPPRGSKAYF